MTALVRRARVPVSPHRRSMIAKVHVAKKQVGMVEDDYRQLLFDVTGGISLSDASDRDIERVIDRFKALGFTPLKAKGADHPTARKARAMWISLHHLGAVRDPSDRALESFARRQLKVAKLQWADQTTGYRLIEALKAMAEREGWQQDTPFSQTGSQALVTLKRRLCEAILAKLKAKGAAAADWTLREAAMRLCGTELAIGDAFATETYDRLAKGLGDKLRRVS